MESKFIGICNELNELGQGIVYYDNNMITFNHIQSHPLLFIFINAYFTQAIFYFYYA